jgi:hypothetical protein
MFWYIGTLSGSLSGVIMSSIISSVNSITPPRPRRRPLAASFPWAALPIT